jgi:hypothetical protein
MKYIQPIPSDTSHNRLVSGSSQIVLGLTHSALRIPHTAAKRKRRLGTAANIDSNILSRTLWTTNHIRLFL